MKNINPIRGTPEKPSFEECYDKIEKEIEKRRSTWTYNYAWIDFDDIKMMILDHIYKKWYLYDDSFPLLNWVNRIISNQIKNNIRNLYGHFAPPCVNCEHYFHDGSCALFGKPSNKCDLYKNWSLKKKEKFNIKMPVAAENHSKEISEMKVELIDFEKSFDSLIKLAERELNPIEFKVFKYIYIDHKSDSEIIKIMKYKPVIINNNKYYRSLDLIKEKILEKIKNKKEEIEILTN